MKKIVLILGMIAVIALGWFVVIQTKNAKPREIQKHLELAQKKEEQQIYVDALAEYKAVLELDPERIDVYQKVVMLDYKMGQFSEFETQANALLKKTPNSYEVLNTLLSYYDENSKQDKALALLKQLIKQAPNDETIAALYKERRGTYTDERLYFTSISDFWNGYAVIERDGKFGLINESGSIVVEPTYDGIGVFDSNGLYAPVKLGEEEYFIDKQGNRKLASDKGYTNFGIFSEDVAPAVFDGMYGYVNDKFSHTEFIWEYLGPMYNDMAAAKQNGKWGIINNKFTELTGYVYDEIAVNDFGICAAQSVVLAKENDKWGIVGNTGEFVVSPYYEDVKPFYEGGAFAAVKKDGLWGFVTFSGLELGSFVYEDAFSFCGSFAAVKQDGLWGVIDGNLEWVINPVFEDVMTMNESGYMAVQKDGLWKWIHLDVAN